MVGDNHSFFKLKLMAIQKSKIPPDVVLHFPTPEGIYHCPFLLDQVKSSGIFAL